MVSRTPEANRKYQAAWYKKNKKLQADKVRARVKELQIWWAEEKKKYSCVKCGENHPSCIDFHHNDPSKKDTGLANAIGRGWSKKRILEEVEKCTTLCANCHRKFHYESDIGIISLEEYLSN